MNSRSVGQMIIEADLLVSVAMNLDNGGQLTRETAQEMWSEACNHFQKIIPETDADSEDGDSARKGAVISALKAGKRDLAESILAELSIQGNIMPSLHRKLLVMIDAYR